MQNYINKPYFRVFLAVAILGMVALAGAALAAETGTLPARQWNQENLDRIKGLAAEPLKFIVMGDNRDQPEIFGRVLKMADQDLGDMVHKVDLDQYRIFFKEVRENFHKPLVTVIGNHELYGDRGLELYREMFGPDYYSFQVGGNFFIVIDDSSKEVFTPEQVSWLENELKKSQAYQTRMVFMHIPLFDPTGSPKPHCLPPEAAARLLALFKKYQVSHVFAAHIHAYYAGEWDGVPYAITGGAGAPLKADNPQHDFYHYLKVTVTGSRVQVQVQRLEQAGRH
jgi:hypothetical protein